MKSTKTCSAYYTSEFVTASNQYNGRKETQYNKTSWYQSLVSSSSNGTTISATESVKTYSYHSVPSGADDVYNNALISNVNYRLTSSISSILKKYFMPYLPMSNYYKSSYGVYTIVNYNNNTYTYSTKIGTITSCYFSCSRYIGGYSYITKYRRDCSTYTGSNGGMRTINSIGYYIELSTYYYNNLSTISNVNITFSHSNINL